MGLHMYMRQFLRRCGADATRLHDASLQSFDQIDLRDPNPDVLISPAVN
jgi:hypothetical protein